jgi:hypothetical protein
MEREKLLGTLSKTRENRPRKRRRYTYSESHVLGLVRPQGRDCEHKLLLEAVKEAWVERFGFNLL